jgi:hypothetical protein
MSPRYSCAHDGQHASRRLPQRTISAPSGSSTVEYTGSSPDSTTPRSRTGWRHAPVRRTCCSQRSRLGSLALATSPRTVAESARRRPAPSSPSPPARTPNGHLSPRTRRHPRQRLIIDKRPQTGPNGHAHDPSPSGVSAPAVSCNEEVFGSSPKAGSPRPRGGRSARQPDVMQARGDAASSLRAARSVVEFRARDRATERRGTE